MQIGQDDILFIKEKLHSATLMLYSIYVKLKARGPNQAREGIIFGPQNNIQLLLDLARRHIANTTILYIFIFLLSEGMKMT